MSEWNQEGELYQCTDLSAELDRRMDGLLKRPNKTMPRNTLKVRWKWQDL